MAQITAALVKELREKTGAGMMDCKKALTENDGDLDAAIDWLRTKGLSQAAKKASRVASEGLVGVKVDGLRAAVVEVNSETDFVARNEKFQDYVAKVAGVTLEAGADIEALKAAAYPDGGTVEAKLTDLIATIGENMALRRAAVLEVTDGVIAAYVHNQVAEGLGKISVLVALESTGDKAKLAELGRQIAMHAAAARPEALDVADVSAESLDRERAVLIEQARESGKPESIIEKMVEGRIRKYYEQVCLLEQIFVIDGETKIRKVVENAKGTVGAPVTLKAFARFELGEGVEKKQEDFAAEVEKALGA